LADEQWQQTWLVVPIDSGGYRIEGHGRSKEQTHTYGEESAGSTSVSSSSKTNRTTSESHSNSVERKEEKKPPELGNALLAYAFIAMIFIGYLLVIQLSKEK
jgi:hypothetical protein